jgi:hypothetical protein
MVISLVIDFEELLKEALKAGGRSVWVEEEV